MRVDKIENSKLKVLVLNLHRMTKIETETTKTQNVLPADSNVHS